MQRHQSVSPAAHLEKRQASTRESSRLSSVSVVEKGCGREKEGGAEEGPGIDMRAEPRQKKLRAAEGRMLPEGGVEKRGGEVG